MSKEIDIVLIKDVKGLGSFGQTKSVKLGYARNYLLPYEFAILSTPANQSRFKALQKREQKRLVQEKENSEALATSLRGLSIKVTELAHEDGTLFGSVSSADIVAEIKKIKGIEIDRHFVALSENIKLIGEYAINIELPQQVHAQVNLSVVGEVKESRSGKKSK